MKTEVEEFKVETILNYIDTKVAGEEVLYRKLDVAAFVAGFVQQIIPDLEAKTDYYCLRQKILHLSFLVHLVCRFGDFDKVYEEYKSVQEDLSSGNISWNDEQYFREWEETVLIREIAGGTEEDCIENESDQNLSPVKNEEENGDTNFLPYNESHNVAVESAVNINIIKPKNARKRPATYQKTDKQKEKERKTVKKKRFIVRPGQTKITCEYCQFQTVSQKNYLQHMFQRHQQNLCPDCGLSFDDFKIFFLHYDTHTSSPSFICDICSASFKTQRKLNYHKEHDHGQASMLKEICQECGKSVRLLKQHIRLMHTKEEALLLCEECEFSTYIKGEMKNHKRTKHIQSVICPHCQKLVKDLVKHLEKMKCDLPEEERKRFQKETEVHCDICLKVLTCRAKLKKHTKVMHTDDLHQCGFCNFQTRHSHNLAQHVRTVHEKKPAKESCPFCSKTCTSLNWHIEKFHS